MSALSGKRILIVEDEFFIAVTTCQVLEELGAVVVGPASTVTQAQPLAETENIDIALLDINLHGQSSTAIAARLEARRIPVVFATGYGRGDGRDPAGRRVLSKPYTQERLVKHLCAALEEKGRADHRQEDEIRSEE